MSTTNKQSDVERLDVILERFSQHTDTCDCVRLADSVTKYSCSCGLTEACKLVKKIERSVAENDMWYRLCAAENGELEWGCIRHMEFINDIKIKLTKRDREIIHLLNDVEKLRKSLMSLRNYVATNPPRGDEHPKINRQAVLNTIDQALFTD